MEPLLSKQDLDSTESMGYGLIFTLFVSCLFVLSLSVEFPGLLSQGAFRTHFLPCDYNVTFAV